MAAKLLLVEDDSNLREIYGARLEAEGYTIVSASDGEEALAKAVKEKPDLIISDIMMPKISGFDMLDILRSTPETKDVKVIVMTALSQDDDRKRGESLGADRYLVKSQVTLDDIVKLVQELLNEKSGTKQPVGQSDDTSSDQAASSDSPTPTASAADLSKEVADFVASSPLMNGTPPTSTKADENNELASTDAATSNTNSTTDEKPAEANSANQSTDSSALPAASDSADSSDDSNADGMGNAPAPADDNLPTDNDDASDDRPSADDSNATDSSVDESDNSSSDDTASAGETPPSLDELDDSKKSTQSDTSTESNKPSEAIEPPALSISDSAVDKQPTEDTQAEETASNQPNDDLEAEEKESQAEIEDISKNIAEALGDNPEPSPQLEDSSPNLSGDDSADLPPDTSPANKLSETETDARPTPISVTDSDDMNTTESDDTNDTNSSGEASQDKDSPISGLSTPITVETPSEAEAASSHESTPTLNRTSDGIIPQEDFKPTQQPPVGGNQEQNPTNPSNG